MISLNITDDNIFVRIGQRIIKEQELVIGPLAWEEAKKVEGLRVVDKNTVEISSDPKSTIDKLVAQYERIFGKASHAVCHNAVRDLVASLSPDEIPASLK